MSTSTVSLVRFLRTNGGAVPADLASALIASGLGCAFTRRAKTEVSRHAAANVVGRAARLIISFSGFFISRLPTYRFL